MTAGSANPFWDETTVAGIGWQDVWNGFQPVSKAGTRYKRSVRPFLPDEEAAWQVAMQDWQSLLPALGDVAWRKAVTEALRGLPDVEALLHLIEQGAGLRQVDFYEMKSFLLKGRLLEQKLAEKDIAFPWWVSSKWSHLLHQLNPSDTYMSTFSLVDVGDPMLTALREDLARLEAAMFASKKAQTDRLRARYGRGPSKEGQYIWEKHEQERLRDAAVDAELRLVQENVFEAIFELVEPAEIAVWREQRERKLVEIEDREMLVLQQLVKVFQPHVESLQGSLQSLARMDWAMAKAEVAMKWKDASRKASAEANVRAGADADADAVVANAKQADGWRGVESARCADGTSRCGSRDELVDTPTCVATWALFAPDHPWRVIGGWHPVVREAVEKRGGTCTPLELDLQRGVGLITGPNMGGKTIVLKTFGLLQALAQHAMPVPADAFHFQPVTYIGLSGGDEQNMVSGLSSFGGEMQRIAHFFKRNDQALLLLDEVARTTNPEEGEALAIGLASYLIETHHTALFASHFPGVAQVAGIQGFRVAGLRAEVLAELEGSHLIKDVLQTLQNAMDYRLVKCDGAEVPKHAMRLAKCFGLPARVLELARQVNSQEDARREEGLAQ